MNAPFVRYRRPLKQPARRLRRDSTPAERKLWYEFLRELDHKFTRQKPLGEYIADFYCSRARLVVEVDGDSHFHPQGEMRDALRSVWLARRGIRVLRFSNAEVMQQFEGVCTRIAQELKS